MRIGLAFAIVLGSAAVASAQRPPAAVPLPAARVVVSDGVFRGEMPTFHRPYTADWPVIIVPAHPLKTGVAPTVPEFRIRAWQEAHGARVLVFGVTLSGPKSEPREQQIASVFVPVDQYVEIRAAEKFRARRLTLTAYNDGSQTSRTPGAGVPAPAPRRIEPKYIDIPVRPWTPR